MYSYTNFWTSVLVFTQFFLCFGRTVQFPSTSVARIQTYRFMYQQTNIRLLLSYSAVIPTLDCTVGPQPMSVYIPHPDGTFRFSTQRSTIYSRNKVNISFCGTFLSSQVDLLRIYRQVSMAKQHTHSACESDLFSFFVKVKVKCSRYMPGVPQRVGRGIALLFHDRGNRRGCVVICTSRPHFTHGKDTVPILQ